MAEQEVKKRSKKRLGSYPAVSVVFSVFLALFIIGMFGMLIIHTHSLTKVIKQNIEMQVYLNKSISDVQLTQIQKRIGSAPYILSNEEGPQINFISKETAAEQFVEETGEDFTSFIGDNPLRDLLRINIDPRYQQSDSLTNIATSIESYGGVYEVVYVENLVDSINENVTKISVVLLGFALVLILIVILLIHNTIKLALFSQRFLIRSMQLVGATSRFIQKPFISRAAIYGLLAGLLASAALFGLQKYAYTQVEDLSSLGDEVKILYLFGGVILSGILLASISTTRAVSKYLKMSLDDLY